MSKKEPVRVLHVVGRMDRGGIETMIMNLYRNIDREKVQFDFLAHYGSEAAYNDEIRNMGGKIFEMPALKDEEHVYYWRLLRYIFALHKFFKEHDYKIVHGHMTNTASIYFPIAKKNGVTTRISHSHSTHGKPGLLGIVTEFLQKPVYRHATDWFACSEAAAYWFYPKKEVVKGRVKLLSNAVDAERFRFTPVIRERMRKEFGVENSLVIGCVAGFRPEKNHIFLVGLLEEILKLDKSAILMFAGDGPCENELKNKVSELGFQEKVIFLGMRTDIPDVMQAMDVIAMPSLFEGLPVSGIEAQANGLHIVASTGVTDEMDILQMCEFIGLEENKEIWAKALVRNASLPRQDTYEKVKNAGYDIHTTALELQEFYLSKYVE